MTIKRVGAIASFGQLLLALTAYELRALQDAVANQEVAATEILDATLAPEVPFTLTGAFDSGPVQAWMKDGSRTYIPITNSTWRTTRLLACCIDATSSSLQLSGFQWFA